MVDIIRLSEPQNHRCCYCSHIMIRHVHIDGLPTPRDAMTKDHYEARTYGGVTTYENMVAACCQCNNLRGEMEAEAFYNLMQKWFKRDDTLHARWHTLSREELYELKQQCLSTHERQLSGLARHYVEFAFRLIQFMESRRRHELWIKARAT